MAKKIGRRDFLKGAGIAAGALAAVPAALVLTSEEAQAQSATTYGVLVDTRRCVNCKACQIACKMWNGNQPDPTTFKTDFTSATWTYVQEYETGYYNEILPGEYHVIIPTENLTIGTYELVIIPIKKYYIGTNITKYVRVNEQTILIPGINVKVARSTFYMTTSGVITTAVLIGISLYGYRIYKIPWIIRATDKAIKALIKGKSVDFSKFPDLNDLLDEVVAPMFEVVKRKIPTKREE